MRISDWSSDVCSSDLNISRIYSDIFYAVILRLIAAARELALVVISDFLDPERVLALDQSQLLVRPHAHDCVRVHEVALADLGADREGMLGRLTHADSGH